MYLWDPEKNLLLQNERGVTFQEVEAILLAGNHIDIIDVPAQHLHPGQKGFVVKIANYIYLVPFKEMGDHIFLITIFPSRKLNEKYIKRRGR